MRRLPDILSVWAVLAAAVVLSCSRTPSGVLSKGEMAELLADIHVGEAVVENNYNDYLSDSAKKVVKQAILEKHGVTQAELDSSFMWYGKHLDRYIEVYEETADILQKRLDNAGAIGASMSGGAVAGDSVDVWAGARNFELSRRSPSDIVAFVLKHDDNWESGDIYTWRVKLHNSPVMARFDLNADYVDGTTEVLSTTFAGDGWHEITFYTDSTRQASRIYGDMRLDIGRDRPVFVDSVELIRNRLQPHVYPMRYRQRLFDLRKSYSED